jgi:hypothetical protein
MTNRSTSQDASLPRQNQFNSRELQAAHAGSEAGNRPAASNTLWRQIDRWVNEGGALGDGTAPSPPERINSAGAA